jgi:hypothetical protein
MKNKQEIAIAGFHDSQLLPDGILIDAEAAKTVGPFRGFDGFS